MGTATLMLPQEVVEGLGQVAQEETAYQAQHAQLLTQFPGQFIAMHNGQVIDHDTDELALFLRVRRQFSQIGILIKHVTLEVEEVWQMRSPCLESA